jgi:hypothetical protein
MRGGGGSGLSGEAGRWRELWERSNDEVMANSGTRNRPVDEYDFSKAWRLGRN